LIELFGFVTEKREYVGIATAVSGNMLLLQPPELFFKGLGSFNILASISACNTTDMNGGVPHQTKHIKRT
jgi:hypothetical protein